MLQGGFEVNQEIAATNKIDAREGGIGDEVLAGEDDHLAEGFGDAVAAFLLDKKAAEAFGRDILGERLGVKRVPGFVQEGVIEVGGKDLEFASAGSVLRGFREGHGDGVGFLAGGTAEDPDADRFVTALLQELGEDVALEEVEGFRVAEKAGDADENVGVEGVAFFGVAAKERGVVVDGCQFVQHDPAVDAALDGGGFVEREIDAGMVAEQEDDFLEAVLPGSRVYAGGLAERGRGTGSLGSVAAGGDRGFVVWMGVGGGSVVFR